jgi:hypothetical protein
MKRSAGVTVIAILSLVGSALTFAMGIVMLAVMTLVPAPHSNQFPGSPIFFKTILVLGSLVYLLPAVWGMVTGIGLWRLKSWARISIIVFAVLLSATGGFSGLISFLVPFPAAPNSGLDPAVMSGIRIGMGLFWLALLGIGIWWLVFFNRPGVKVQFVRPATEDAGGSTLQTGQFSENKASDALAPGRAERPLSITILAWLLLAGCAFLPLGIVLRAPAVFFTRLLTGWSASAVFLAFTALQLWIGIGLLRLKPAARTAAIIYFIFGAVNTAVFYLAPGSHTRLAALLDSEQTMFPWMQTLQSQPQFLFDLTPMLVIGGVAGAVAATIPLYFLITRKLAFEKAAADLGSVQTPFS